jgi:hypothetical protein
MTGDLPFSGGHDGKITMEMVVHFNRVLLAGPGPDPDIYHQ